MKPADAERASRPTVPAGYAGVILSDAKSADLQNVPTASAATSVPHATIYKWLTQERIRCHGRSRYGGPLVSCSEISVAKRRKDRAIHLTAAATRLRMSPSRVQSLCDDGTLTHWRYGRTFEIDSGSVDEFVERLATLVSLPDAEQEYGLPKWVLERWDAEGLLQIECVTQLRYVVRSALQDLLDRLEADPYLCTVCGKPTAPGRTAHSQCRSTAGALAKAHRWEQMGKDDRFREMTSHRVAVNEWWVSPEGQARRQELGARGLPGRPPKEKLRRSCWICGEAILWKESQGERADREKRRAVCQRCWRPWIRALCEARWAVAGADPDQPFSEENMARALSALTIGGRLEDELRGQWPRKTGRRPPIALDIVIEVLFADGFSDAQIRELLVRMYATLSPSERRHFIGWKGARVNPRYVTTRRGDAGIRRRPRAISL